MWDWPNAVSVQHRRSRLVNRYAYTEWETSVFSSWRYSCINHSGWLMMTTINSGWLMDNWWIIGTMYNNVGKPGCHEQLPWRQGVSVSIIMSDDLGGLRTLDVLHEWTYDELRKCIEQVVEFVLHIFRCEQARKWGCWEFWVYEDEGIVVWNQPEWETVWDSKQTPPAIWCVWMGRIVLGIRLDGVGALVR